jgi:sec-independent protein translocase protein TatB
MFDIGWSELVVIAIVALIAIGPKELPGVLRTVGNYMGKIRRMAAEFQGQFHEAMREAEMADLKKQVDEMADTAKGFANIDPLADVRKDVESFAADPLATHVAPPPEPAPSEPQPSETAAVPAATAAPETPQAEAKAEVKSGGGA